MVVTRSRENKQMEDELATLKTKLQYLDEKILGLHLQHLARNNRQNPKSSTDIRFSSSNNFHGLKLDFPWFNGDDPTEWIYREK